MQTHTSEPPIRTNWEEAYQQAATDAYQLQRTRDALMETVSAMFRVAAEHDADFLEPYKQNLMHLIKEGVIFPETATYHMELE